ncbi:BglG family transcription antiterminator [Marinisporobacter balticus]|uniref:BglG family transcriptional antiterminator n=1 Tax=Marinisporobacter balticus TaxID=2018667 RepID=A0A4V2SBV0_9FIRM|nr:PRD domain-containing protein [Marinisporobacter balticus]TCO76940.1 BglG family transcriptional antiterminator [Marinisporobacter balticus]
MGKYVIQKILSNNVVLVEKENQNYIFVGKGIGFGKKKGYSLENPQGIEEKFISLNGLKENEYEKFFIDVDPKIIELVKEIMEMIKNDLGEVLNPNVHVGFIDHINFAINRLKEGIEIINPFLLETKLLYPVEFDLAQKAIKILKENLKIYIPEAEVGFLALHIYGGRGNENKTKALENSKMLNKILTYVEMKFHIKLDKNSFDCNRFIMHLRGVINRVMHHQSIENILLPKLKEDLIIEFKAAYDISKIMEQSLKVSIPESEVGYMALHLHRMNSQKNE